MSDNELRRYDELEVSSECLVKKRNRQSTKIDKNFSWTKVMVHQLISAVEEYPVLWDIRVCDYRDLNKRTSAWQRIEEDTFNMQVPFEQIKVSCVFFFYH